MLVDNTRALVSVYKTVKSYDKAIALLEAWLCVDESEFSAGNPEDRGVFWKDLGDMYKATERMPDAMRAYEQASMCVSDPVKLATVLSVLGWAHAACGDVGKCIQALQRVVQLRLAHDGSTSVPYADSLVNLGRALKVGGHLEQAVTALGTACQVYVSCGLGSSSQYADAHESYNDTLLAAGRPEAAGT